MPANGGAGLAAHTATGYSNYGTKGKDGSNRGTGGGGQGGYITNGNNGSSNSYIGLSTGGSSYSGGNGSGGLVRCNCSALGASYTSISY